MAGLCKGENMERKRLFNKKEKRIMWCKEKKEPFFCLNMWISIKDGLSGFHVLRLLGPDHKVLTYIEYRTVSGAFRTPNY
jgi:hypothetical protein